MGHFELCTSVSLFSDTQLYKMLCPSVGRLVGWSVVIELKSGKTRISAPAHPSATDGRVSGLVSPLLECMLASVLPICLYACMPICLYAPPKLVARHIEKAIKIKVNFGWNLARMD